MIFHFLTCLLQVYPEVNWFVTCLVVGLLGGTIMIFHYSTFHYTSFPSEVSQGRRDAPEMCVAYARPRENMG